MLQACPTYNKFASHEYLLEKCYEVEASDCETARKTAVDTSEKISTGVLYQDKTRSTFIDQLEARKGIETRLVDEVSEVDVSALLAKFS